MKYASVNSQIENSGVLDYIGNIQSEPVRSLLGKAVYALQGYNTDFSQDQREYSTSLWKLDERIKCIRNIQKKIGAYVSNNNLSSQDSKNIYGALDQIDSIMSSNDSLVKHAQKSSDYSKRVIDMHQEFQATNKKHLGDIVSKQYDQINTQKSDASKSPDLVQLPSQDYKRRNSIRAWTYGAIAASLLAAAGIGSVIGLTGCYRNADKKEGISNKNIEATLRVEKPNPTLEAIAYSAIPTNALPPAVLKQTNQTERVKFKAAPKKEAPYSAPKAVAHKTTPKKDLAKLSQEPKYEGHPGKFLDSKNINGFIFNYYDANNDGKPDFAVNPDGLIEATAGGMFSPDYKKTVAHKADKPKLTPKKVTPQTKPTTNTQQNAQSYQLPLIRTDNKEVVGKAQNIWREQVRVYPNNGITREANCIDHYKNTGRSIANMLDNLLWDGADVSYQNFETGEWKVYKDDRFTIKDAIVGEGMRNEDGSLKWSTVPVAGPVAIYTLNILKGTFGSLFGTAGEAINTAANLAEGTAQAVIVDGPEKIVGKNLVNGSLDYITSAAFDTLKFANSTLTEHYPGGSEFNRIPESVYRGIKSYGTNFDPVYVPEDAKTLIGPRTLSHQQYQEKMDGSEIRQKRGGWLRNIFRPTAAAASILGVNYAIDQLQSESQEQEPQTEPKQNPKPEPEVPPNTPTPEPGPEIPPVTPPDLPPEPGPYIPPVDPSPPYEPGPYIPPAQ